MDPERVLAFRLARSGLAERTERDLAAAAACPASDFSRDAALLALGARSEDVSREGYLAAVDAGDVVVAHAIRGAIHALAPADRARFGRALIAGEDGELAAQLGQQVKRLAAAEGFAPTEALAEVVAATREALAERGPLDRVELHAEWRRRLRPALLPWCKGCKSHHVAPMLWRYATIEAGGRLDAQRRYVLDDAGAGAATGSDASDAVRRFLRFYGPATPGEFADWAGMAKPHGRRSWDEVAGELEQMDGGGWLLRGDAGALASPPDAKGVRLLPPGDPYLQGPNRGLLAPDPALRKRLFRPVASPGAVLRDGRLAGLWRVKLKGRRAEVAVEPLGRLPRGVLEEEAQRVARLRGAEDARLAVG